MRSTLTAIIAAIEAGAVALAGLLIVAVPAALLWIFPGDLGMEPVQVAAGAVATWLLAHFVPVTLGMSAETAVGFGLAPEPLSFELSLAPLGLTVFTAWLAIRSGRRFAARGGVGAAGVLGGGIGFAAITALVLPLARGFVEWPGWAAVLLPAAVYVVSALAAYLFEAGRTGHHWWLAAVQSVQRGVQRTGLPGAAALPARAATALRIAAGSLAGLVLLAAAAVSVAIVGSYVEITALSQGLQLDPLGAFLVFVLQLALLPVLLSWALAWLTGAGFAVGVGSSVTPFETLLGPLPALPLFGAFPQGWGSAGAIAPALVVLVGVVVGVLAARCTDLRRATVVGAIVSVLAAAILTGGAVTALAALARGALGPDRLASTGSEPWLAGGLAAAEIGGGLLLGVLAGRADRARLRAALPALVPTGVGLRRGSGSASDAASGAEGATWGSVDSAEAFDAEGAVALAEAVRVAEAAGAVRATDGARRSEDDEDDQDTVPVDLETRGESEREDDGESAAESRSEHESSSAAGSSEHDTDVIPEPDGRGERDDARSDLEEGGSAFDEGDEGDTDSLLRAYSWDSPEPAPKEDQAGRSPWWKFRRGR